MAQSETAGGIAQGLSGALARPSSAEMKTLSIRSQLALLSLACLTLVATLSTLVVFGSRGDAQALRDLYERGFQPMLALQEVDRQLKEVRFRLAGVLLEQIPVTGSRNHLKEVRERAPSLWDSYASASGASKGARHDLVEQIDKGWARFNTFAAELEAAYAANDRKKLTTLLEDDWPKLHIALVKPLEMLLPHAIKEAESVYTERSTAASQRQIGALVALTLGGLTLFGLFMWFNVRLRNAFAQVVMAMRKLANGDLGARLHSRACTETMTISEEFAAALAQLNTLVSRIHGIATHMQTSSVEIAQGHANLSTRTTQQAASLQETATSMEEMTTTVAQNADNARKASEISRNAFDIVQRGGQAVSAVVTTMTGISESSRKIADIIGVIDSIAFQTNILALNAAVEAARAGEQGRGFAVVAAEVRNLAQRASASAKEIRELISDSVRRVEAGSAQVTAAGQTISEVVNSVQKVDTLILEISTASQEQARSLLHVSNAVQQLEGVTQQNAAMVEESTAVSLEEQAAALMRAVAGFQLDTSISDMGQAEKPQGRARSADRTGPRTRVANVNSWPA